MISLPTLQLFRMMRYALCFRWIDYLPVCLTGICWAMFTLTQCSVSLFWVCPFVFFFLSTIHHHSLFLWASETGREIDRPSDSRRQRRSTNCTNKNSINKLRLRRRRRLRRNCRLKKEENDEKGNSWRSSIFFYLWLTALGCSHRKNHELVAQNVVSDHIFICSTKDIYLSVRLFFKIMLPDTTLPK